MEPPDRTHNPPSASQFLSRLISQLSAVSSPAPHDTDKDTARLTTRYHNPQPHTQNPFSSLGASQLSKVKRLLLTLHCLFPNELLLALDILDRKLVRRFSVDDLDGNENAAVAPECQEGFTYQQNDILQPESNRAKEEVFFVLSTSSPTTAGSSRKVPEKSYEVRLHAWNCTCPAFVLAAFKEPWSSRDAEANRDAYWFGGILAQDPTRLTPPMCKHLLACILGSRCAGLFGAGLEGKIRLSQTELAGWCAGWDG